MINNRNILIIFLSFFALIGLSTLFGYGTYKGRGDYSNDTGNILLSADEKELVWYNLDDPYVSDALDANTVSLRASGSLTETYYLRWPIDKGDPCSFLMTPGVVNSQLRWMHIDANFFRDDPNEFALPTLTPGSRIFVDANGFPLYEDNDNAYFDDINDFAGFALGHIASGTRPNNYIQVYTLLDFEPTLFNTAIGRGSDDVATGPNSVTIGYGAGALLDEGYENALGGKDAGRYLQDANDNAGWGYKVIGGNGTGEIAPAAIRDEAYAIIGSTKIAWFDPNYTLIEQELLAGVTGGTSIAINDNGDIVASVGGATIHTFIWDVNLVRTTDFFVPDGGWGALLNVGAVRWSTNGDYLYLAVGVSGPIAGIYKFDASDGSEEWHHNYLAYRSSLYVDASDNVYFYYYVGVNDSGVKWLDSDGNLAGTAQINEFLNKDIWVDEDNDRIYIVGDGDGNLVLAAINTDGTNIDTFDVGENDAWTCVIESDGYVYACGESSAAGIGGADATVFKFNSELVLQASYETTEEALYMCFNDDGNLIINVYDTTQVILDTNLNLVDTFDCTPFLTDFRGGENIIIPYMDDGTSPNVHRVTALGAYAGSSVVEGADDGLYLGTYSGQYNETDPNHFFLDNLDRGDYPGNQQHGMMYGYFDVDPNDQWLTFNVGELNLDFGRFDVNDVNVANDLTVAGDTYLTDVNITGTLDVNDVNVAGLTIAGFDEGSVLFTDVNGLVTQDNTNFNYDDTGDVLNLSGLTVTGNEINIATTQTPASATAAGTTGDMAWDSDYVYVAVASNTWKRAALTTWGIPAENVIYAGENVIFAAEQVVYP